MTLRKVLNNYVKASDTATEINIDSALDNLQAAFVGIATGDGHDAYCHIFDAALFLVEVRERRRIVKDLLQLMTDHSDTEED